MGGKKLLRLGVFSMAILLAIGLVISLLAPKEPRYQGHSLTYWRSEFRRTHHSGYTRTKLDPNNDPSFAAIRQIGTNAFPFLLRDIGASDSPLRKKIAIFIDERHWTSLHLEPAPMRQLHGLSTLRLLADRAQPMVPALVELTKDKHADVRNSSLMALRIIQPAKQTMLPVLLRLIHDPDKAVSQNAALVLRDQFPKEAVAAGVSKLFPDLKDLPTTEANTNKPAAK